MTEQSLVQAGQQERLVWQVTAATLCRVVLNTARRFAYPFAPVLGRALGVPISAIMALIAVNNLTGLLSPVLGSLADRWGYRLMMLVGLGALVIGMTAGGLFPVYGVIVVALFLAGLGKSLFDPAIQATMGERVPFSQRGRVIGILEFGWAGSVLLGIPLIGLLIDRWGWRAPFFVLAGLGLLGLLSLRRLFPPRPTLHRVVSSTLSFGQRWQLLRQSKAVVGVLGFGFLLALANDTLFVIQGIWLEEQFGLGVVALGLATTVVGVAELVGEILTATIADRLNLKRALIGGAVLSSLSYLLLPFLAQSLWSALLGLFLIFVTLEFTIVTSISLETELLPEARATVLASHQAASSLGRMLGAGLGGLVWPVGGLPVISLAATVISGLAVGLLVWGLYHWRRG